MFLPLVLYVPFFLPAHIQRRGELLFALVNNLALPEVSRVVLLPEQSGISQATLFSHHKLHWAESGAYSRRKFSDVFELIRAANDEHLALIANADIAFDESLARAMHVRHFGNAFLALSRWHSKEFMTDAGQLSSKASASHDAWLFNSNTVRDLIPPSVGRYYFGQPGCDQRLLYETNRAGLCAVNAAHNITLAHVHKSARRSYIRNKMAPAGGPYGFADPSELSVSANGTLVCTTAYWEMPR